VRGGPAERSFVVAAMAYELRWICCLTMPDVCARVGARRRVREEEVITDRRNWCICCNYLKTWSLWNRILDRVVQTSQL